MAKFGTVGYLNAAPLTAHIDTDLHELVEGHPSEIASMLLAGEVDLGLVPVVAVLSDPTLRVASGHCIGSEGAVESVFLVAETPIEEWTTVLFDEVSRTSVILSHLLLDGPLAERVSPILKRTNTAATQGLDQARGTTAALVIGDVARDLPERLTTRIDLAELWTDWTGLPFVFAVWAGRLDVDQQALMALRDAGHRGVSERAELYAGADADYLTRCIRYELDERALVGMRRFAALAHGAGLVPSGVFEFYGPLQTSRVRHLDADVSLTEMSKGAEISCDELSDLVERVAHNDLSWLAQSLSEQRGGMGPVGVSWTLPIVVNAEMGAQEITDRLMELKSFGGQNIVLRSSELLPWSVSEWCIHLASWKRQGGAIWAHSMASLEALAKRENTSLVEMAACLTEAGLCGLASGAVVSLRDEGSAGLQELERQRALGLGGGAVLEYGFGEEGAERVRTLFAVKALRHLPWVRVLPASPDAEGADAMSATAQDHLQMTSLARIILSDVTDQWAIWLPHAPVIAQQALLAGCNGLGPVLLKEGSQLADWEQMRDNVQHAVHGVGLSLRGEEEIALQPRRADQMHQPQIR